MRTKPIILTVVAGMGFVVACFAVNHRFTSKQGKSSESLNLDGDRQQYTQGSQVAVFASSNIVNKPQDESFSPRQGGRGRRRIADRNDYANWSIPAEWKTDVFTFVRVKFDSYGYARPGRMWDNDYPDCDWNFSVRLHELTSLKVDPNGKVLELSDPTLFDYPFLFMSNANQIALSDDEAKTLRQYLLNGGFVMIDDFWAPRAFEHITEEMSKVFPDRKPIELSSDHPIFSLVYKLKGTPQVPSVHAWRRGDLFEYWHGDPEGDEDPHFWGYFDDDNRLVALLCHNNDIGDGWEREGENEEYFHQYSERVSYPLGINIVVYALTH